jgi:hypothetical protein
MVPGKAGVADFGVIAQSESLSLIVMYTHKKVLLI